MEGVILMGIHGSPGEECSFAPMENRQSCQGSITAIPEKPSNRRNDLSRQLKAIMESADVEQSITAARKAAA